MAKNQYDLSPQLAKNLDRHLVLPILEFLQVCFFLLASVLFIHMGQS